MDVSVFDFNLPQCQIATRPARPRHSAKMLVVAADGRLTHTTVLDLPRFLGPRDILVVNDTRVIPARLRGRRRARQPGPDIDVEVLLYGRLAPNRFEAFARPARRLRPGDTIALGQSMKAVVEYTAAGGIVGLCFDTLGQTLDQSIAREGELPLPPYMGRAADDADCRDYQTIFARRNGSVAAPTAGLHFTPDLLRRLEAKGIGRETITLHVGPGTFLPVSVKDTAAHRMHSEWAQLRPEAASRLNAARLKGRQIVAVGTTSLRTLESAASPGGQIDFFEGQTDIFITPGYNFRTAEALLTNFHLPRSTLFMLVSAFCGVDVMKTAYAEAIARGYRFYSYGDACLLFRKK